MAQRRTKNSLQRTHIYAETTEAMATNKEVNPHRLAVEVTATNLWMNVQEIYRIYSRLDPKCSNK